MMSAIGITNLVASSLSLLGCIFVFLKILLTNQITFSLRMALFLAIGDLIFTISNFLTPFSQDNEDLCFVEGLVREFSLAFTIFWAVCIAFLSYHSTIDPKKYTQLSVMRLALAIGFIWAIFVCLIPALKIQGIEYGQDNMFCWIVVDSTGLDAEAYKAKVKILLLSFQIIPFVLAFLVLFYCYFRQYCYLKTLPNDVLQYNDLSAGRLLWYPLSFLLSILPCVIDNYLRGFQYTNSTVFMYLHVGIFHSVGLINGLVYGTINQKKRVEENLKESELSLSISDHESDNSTLDHLERVGKETTFR